MIATIRTVGLLLLLTHLVACSSLVPIYEPPLDGQPTTTITIDKLMRPKLCVDGKWYRLKKNESGQAIIPSGKRITIKNTYFEENNEAYQDLFFSCDNSLSFVATEDKTYYGNFDIVGTTCRIDIFVADPTKAVGLETVMVGKPEC